MCTIMGRSSSAESIENGLDSPPRDKLTSRVEGTSSVEGEDANDEESTNGSSINEAIENKVFQEEI